MNSAPAVNHWHESLLVTGQLGSAEALPELGGDVQISSAEILAAQEVWEFSGPPYCCNATEPTPVRSGESSPSLPAEQSAELQRMRPCNCLVRRWAHSSFELTET